MVALVMVFGLFCSTSLWAGNGQQIKDGSMLDVNLDEAKKIEGVVIDCGVSGTGLTLTDVFVDEVASEDITVYGMGPLKYWEEENVTKPTDTDKVIIYAVEVTYLNGTTRLIAVSVSIEGVEEPVLLRTDEGPAWRGVSKQGGTSNATGDCSACPNSGTCDKSQQGGGTGTCPLVD